MKSSETVKTNQLPKSPRLRNKQDIIDTNKTLLNNSKGDRSNPPGY
jgi:hypothetical protein